LFGHAVGSCSKLHASEEGGGDRAATGSGSPPFATPPGLPTLGRGLRATDGYGLDKVGVSGLVDTRPDRP